MKKTKKLLACLTAIAMSATIFIGCGSSGGGTTQTKADPAGKTTITVWHYFDGQQQQNAMQNLADKYNKSQDKVEVQVEFVPRAELTKQFTIGLVADKLPDIGLVDNPDMASFSAMGLFADITDKMNSYDGKDQFLSRTDFIMSVRWKILWNPTWKQ